MKVIKRNGEKVPFEKNKIARAIEKAYLEVFPNRQEEALKCGKRIAYDISFGYTEPLSVEEIQNKVEKDLILHAPADVARAYIRYRYKRELLRQEEKEKAIKEKLMAEKIDNQNANVDEHSFGGRMGEANSVVMKDFALNHCMSKMARENHLNNEIYEHDLDAYAVGSHNCLSIPFDKLLANGFNTRQTDVRPANSLNTAFQLVAVIFQLQSLQQFGK